MLSQPSLQTLLLVAQMCVSAALRTPQFLEVLFCATSGTSAPSPIQKHHVGHAISGRAASPACSEGDLPVQLTLLIFLVFGLPGSDFFARKTAGTSTDALPPPTGGRVGMRKNWSSLSGLASVLWLRSGLRLHVRSKKWQLVESLVAQQCQCPWKTSAESVLTTQ